jgi:hypothetical protein
MRLGERLSQAGLVSPAQVEAALGAQVIYGGRLGTNLVERGALKIDDLARVLGQHVLAPVPPPGAFDSISSQVLAFASRARCERLRVCPFAVDRETLHVAMTDPHDAEAVSELAGATSRRILQYVIPELRFFYCLERYYGVPRGARFARAIPSSQLALVQAHADQRRARPELIHSGPFETLPDVPRAEELEDAMRVPAGSPMRARGERRSYLVARPAASAEARGHRPAALGYAEARATIDQARERDAIARALIGHALSWCAGALLFVPRAGNLLGWRGWVPGLGEDVGRLAVPLGPPSLINDALETRTALRGMPDASLHQLFGAPAPGEACAYPILLRDRLVNLLYAFPAVRAEDSQVAALSDLAQYASAAWARLLIERKRT